MLESVSALVATVAGKVVLGTAVAAASVGGLHAADVVDVPGLPDRAAEQAITATDEADDQGQEPEESGEPAETADQGGEPAEAATEGQETAEAAQAKQDAAADFTEAMGEWSTCAEEAETAELDPVEECGERPHPRDFGLTDPPTSQADDRGRPETTPVPDAASDGADNDPTDRGTTTPPDGVPSGAPSQTPGRP